MNVFIFSKNSEYGIVQELPLNYSSDTYRLLLLSASLEILLFNAFSEFNFSSRVAMGLDKIFRCLKLPGQLDSLPGFLCMKVYRESESKKDQIRLDSNGFTI